MPKLHVALAFEAFGARVGVEAPVALAPRVRPRLPPTARPTGPEHLDVVYRIEPAQGGAASSAGSCTLSSTGATTLDPEYTSDFDDVCEELEADMHYAVAVAARGWLFVHAGVVEWGGAAIVAPGGSFVGKSSLVLALVAAGATYFSDEYAVFDEEGLVHPYRKPLSERRKGETPLLHLPESLGRPPARSPVPLGRTVVTEFSSGATWQPAPITPGDVMLELFAHSVGAESRPEHALARLARAVDGTGGLHGERGEAADVAAALLQS